MDEKEKERILRDLETPNYATALKELVSYLRFLKNEEIWVESIFSKVVQSLTGDGSDEALKKIGMLTVGVLQEN